MEVKIARKELKEALAGLTRVIPRRTSVAILQGIKFHTQDQRLYATATDLEQEASYAFESATVKAPGAFVVMAEALKPYARGGDNETVTMEERNALMITHQVSGLDINDQILSYDVDDYPATGVTVPTAPVEGDFLASFRKAFTFTSHDESRNVLMAVNLDVSKKGHCIVATDGRRLACFNSMALPLARTCNVKPGKFLVWPKLTGNVEIGVAEIKDAEYFALKSGPWTYTTRTTPGTYPNWRQVVPSDAGPHGIHLTDEDSVLLTKVLPGFAGHNGSSHEITLAGQGGLISLHGYSNESSAWSSLELKASRYEGPDNTVTVDRSYLLDALDVGFRVFRFTDNRSPLVSDDGQGGRYVLMPTTPMVPDNIKVTQEPDTESASQQEPEPEPAPVKIQAEEAVAAKPDTQDKPISGKTDIQPKPREKPMPEKTTTQDNETPLDRILAAYEAVKVKLAESRAGLNEIADAIKQAARDQKSQRSELENARSLLAKLQAVKL